MNGGNAESLLYSLREYLLSCPLLPPGAFGLQQLDSLFPAGALLPQQEQQCAQYLDGSSLQRFDFLLCLRESHTACTADTLESCARLEALGGWIRLQNARRFLPYLTGGRQPLSLRPLGQAAAGEKEEKSIAWRLPCRLTYLCPPPKAAQGGHVMTLTAFMADYAPKAGFAGCLFGEDWVLALDTEGGAVPEDFLVARAGMRQLQAGFSAKQWLCYGETGSPLAHRETPRRFFLLEGDRQMEDPVQRRLFCFSSLYAGDTGAALRYLFFCLRDGSGESGQLLPLIEQDAGGMPGEPAPFRLRLVQCGEAPRPYHWAGNLP